MNLHDYDEQQRTKAASAGEPLPRMDGPGAPIKAWDTPTLWCWLRSGKLVSSPGDQHIVVPTMSGALAQAWDAGSLVVADRAALSEVRRIITRSGPKGRSREIQVNFASRLAASVKLVVLADALARKFWMPKGMDPTKANSWRKAFDLPTGPESLFRLGDMVWQSSLVDDEDWSKSVLGKAHDGMRSIERKAVGAVCSGSAEAAIDAFTGSQHIGDMWSAVEHFDPRLRFRFLHDGTVVRFNPNGQQDGGVSGSVTQPFRLREGEVSVLPDGAGLPVGSAMMASVSFDNSASSLVASLKPVRKPGTESRPDSKGFRCIDGALMSKSPVLLVARPYLRSAHSKSSRSARSWTQKAAPAIGGRDLPLDVIIAGNSE